MNRPRRRLSRINLASENATSLTVVSRFDWTEERGEIIAQLPKADLPLPFEARMAEVTYSSKGGVPHEASLNILALDVAPIDDQPPIYVVLRYSLPSDPSPRGARFDIPVSDIIETALLLGVPESQHADVSFRFRGRGGSDLWFPLPTRLAGSRAPEDLFEVRGVRGVKLRSTAADAWEYRFALECPHGEDVPLELSFDIPGAFDPHSGRLALRRAAGIVPDLVPSA